MNPGQRRHRAGGPKQVHILEIAAMLGRERRHILGDLLYHRRIGLRRDVPAAELLGQGDHTERHRHPRLGARGGVLPVRIALDPDQFGRPAADVEQNSAPALRIQQRRTADDGECGFRLAVDHFKSDAGLGRDPIPKAVGVQCRAAGFGSDQPQALGLSGADFVAANAQCGDGAVDRGIADVTGRRDALAEPDDSRERIDHTKAFAGRSGDQEAAIVGAEVQRRINAGSGRRWPDSPRRISACHRRSLQAAIRPLAVVSAQPEAIAKPRVIFHPSLSVAAGGQRGISVHGKFSSAQRRCNSRHMPPCSIRRCRSVKAALSAVGPPKCVENRHSRDTAMQDYTSSNAQDNAIALQKFGVGQPVRRKEDDTLVRGKGKYTDDFSLPGQVYAWIVRSSHAHGIVRGIDTEAAKAMPGVLGVWTGADLASANYGPYTCGLPLKSRDGSPLLQTNRTALMSDKVRYVGDPVAFVVAETLAQARDAAEAVVLDIDPLPAVTSAEEAAKPGAPQLYDHIPNNVALEYHYGDAAKVDAAFAEAAHVTRLDIVNTRVAVVSMEPRVALAAYDKASERFTLQVPTQGVSGNKVTFAKILNVPNDKVRILTANVCLLYTSPSPR